jgi:hypothetical protein
LGAALTKAKGTAKAIHVCTGTYEENVQIQGPVVVRGGFECTQNWALSTNLPVVAPRQGIPLTVRYVAGEVFLTNLTFRAPNAVDAGASSVAAWVVASAKVFFARVNLVAGSGFDGQTPPAPAGIAVPAPAGAPGGSWSPMECPSSKPKAPCLGQGLCVDLCTLEAAGGADATPGPFGMPGRGGQGANIDQGFPVAKRGDDGLPQGLGGAGGHHASPYREGRPGRDGAMGAAGRPASLGVGSVTNDGYVATNMGGHGAAGSPGGGGGGGAGGVSNYHRAGDLTSPHFYLGGGGGQGGYGGSGGEGAKGAQGGGASLALLVKDAAVVVTDSTLDTAEGGRGGDGCEGAPGQAGGPGGQGGTSSVNPAVAWAPDPSVGAGYPGGAGGRGGKGGVGGPGGGGPSVGIFVSGPAPVLGNVTFHVGRGGQGGRALVGPGATDGIAQEVFVVSTSTVGVP